MIILHTAARVKIIRGVHMLKLDADLSVARKVIVTNVWFLKDSEGRVFIIDTGDSTERLALRWSLSKAGLKKPGDVTAILLTHRHRDHAANAAWLRDKFKCPVICHANEKPFLDGSEKPPLLADRPISLPFKIVCKIQDMMPPQCKIDETYTSVDWKWDFAVYEAFGHTEGSVMLYHKPSQTLFSGDAILSGLPATWFYHKLRLAMPEFTPDVESAHQSVKRLIPVLPPVRRLCPGHGPEIEGDINSMLTDLIKPQTHKTLLERAKEWGTPRLPAFVGRLH